MAKDDISTGALGGWCIRAIGPIPALVLFLFSFPVGAQEVPGWERIQRHGLTAHNMGPAEVLTPAQCAAKCDAAGGCMGFDYYRNSGQCLLNDADGRTAPGALKPNGPVDFYQRVRADPTGDPSQPLEPGQPDWRVSDAYCQAYARTAVAQNRHNIDHQCGYSGRRWTGDHGGHYRWCRSVDASVSNAENQARDAELRACRQSGVLGRPWTSPAGRTCFQRWVRDTEARLNDNHGSDQYNRDKPFQINIYGLISFPRARSIFAPDDWNAPDVKRNRFAWLWKHMTYEGQYWYFRHTAPDPRDRVQLHGLRWYVGHCMRAGPS